VRRKLISMAIGLALFILGSLRPRLVLLDVPFGLAFRLADAYGLWHPGPAWVQEHRLVALFCFLVWPVLISVVTAYILLYVSSKLWFSKAKYSHWIAILFLISVFVVILIVRVEPGSVRGSYFGYWAENY
jgi:hypothetical protein